MSGLYANFFAYRGFSVFIGSEYKNGQTYTVDVFEILKVRTYSYGFVMILKKKEVGKSWAICCDMLSATATRQISCS